MRVFFAFAFSLNAVAFLFAMPLPSRSRRDGLFLVQEQRAREEKATKSVRSSSAACAFFKRIESEIKKAKEKNNSPQFPFSLPCLLFVFLSSKSQPRANAVVDDPPRGQQARTRPPHERPGEGRGAREFRGGGRRSWREVDWREEKGDAALCLFLFSSVFKTGNSSRVPVKGDEGRRLLCADVVENARESCGGSWGSESLLFSVDGRQGKNGWRASRLDLFPLSLCAMLGSPRRILQLPPHSRLLRVDSKTLEALRGAKRGDSVVESGIGNAEKLAMRPFFFLSVAPPFSPFDLLSSRTMQKNKTRQNRSRTTSTPSTCTTSSR